MARSSSRTGGFTFAELMIVVAIIALLAGVLLPALMSAWRQSARARTAMDLQTLARALEEYKNRTGDYPRPEARDTGAMLLKAALTGKFQPKPGAQSVGPFVRADELKIDGGRFVDANGRPILYYVAARKQPDISRLAGVLPPGFAGNETTYTFPAGVPNRVQQTLYNFADNDGSTLPDGDKLQGFKNTEEKFRIMLGDANANGAIDGAESPVTTGPFLLWTAGRDTIFGTDDDVTNFK